MDPCDELLQHITSSQLPGKVTEPDRRSELTGHVTIDMTHCQDFLFFFARQPMHVVLHQLSGYAVAMTQNYKPDFWHQRSQYYYQYAFITMYSCMFGVKTLSEWPA